MLGNTKGKRLDTYVENYVIFDLETTGISCITDKVIEISAVKVLKGRIADKFSTLVNPEMKIPFRASQVNHITDDMVEDAPVFERALADFDAFAGDMVLAGHNIHTFDMKFIQRDAKAYWGKVFTNDYIDTLVLARRRLPQLSNYKLTDLAGYYRIPAAGAHRALADCMMNQQVFERLGKESDFLSAEIKGKKCPRCGQLMKKRKGRFGEFWGCSGYPNCRYTENV